MSPLNTHLDSWKQAALFLIRCHHPLKSLLPPNWAGWESLLHLFQRSCPLGYRLPFPAKERGWSRNRWQLRPRLSQLLWPFRAQQLQKYLFSRVRLFCDCSPPGSSVPGISQARVLEWVAISFSRGSSWPRDWTHVSHSGRWILYHWTTWEVHK